MKPERFAELRKAKGLTQAQFAELLNMSVRAITAWEAGDLKPPINKLEWIADFYGVSTDYLLGRTDIPNVYVHEGIKMDDGREGILYTTKKDLPPIDQEQVRDLVQRAEDDGRNGVTLPGGSPIPEDLQRFVEQSKGHRFESCRARQSYAQKSLKRRFLGLIFTITGLFPDCIMCNDCSACKRHVVKMWSKKPRSL